MPPWLESQSQCEKSGPSIGVHQIGEDQWAYVILPWVHRIFSNLKVWALGVYHGLRRKHLQSYLDKFHLPLQPSPHKARRVPIPPRHRRRPPALNYNMLLSPKHSYKSLGVLFLCLFGSYG
jgi:hypothetical protein